jgi:hypothetical protein
MPHPFAHRDLRGAFPCRDLLLQTDFFAIYRYRSRRDYPDAHLPVAQCRKT